MWNKAQPIPCPRSKEGTAVPEPESLRVLVVDDDPSVLILMGRYLTVAGHHVLTARNGIEAMRILLAEGPSVVITDWVMPQMNGLELCKAIRAHEGISFAYIIIMTAQRTEEDRLVEAFGAGADDYLRTPFKPSELLARLRAGERIIKLQEQLDSRNRQLHRYNAQVETANSKLATANEELQRMATTDELTGLANRREALARLSDYWASSQRRGQPLACIVLDLDRFKSCNDAYGHTVGDRVLKETAICMQQAVRRDEYISRIGGDEFLVLCPGSTEAMAAVAAERLRRAAEANLVRGGDLELRVTISAGVAECSPDMNSPDDLLHAADDALYAAKDAGRSTVWLASAGDVDSVADDPLDVWHRISAGDASNTSLTTQLSTAKKPDESARLLVVDDDHGIRTLCRRLLEREGYEVTEAADGARALAKIEEEAPDVIIMDAIMPDIDGLEYTRRLKADPDTRLIPVIIAGARTDATDIVAALEAGADEYLAKPLNPKELVLRVRTMVRLRRELTKSKEVRGEQSRALGLLLDFSCGIAAADSLDAVLERTVATAATFVGCRRVSIMLPDVHNRFLTVAKCLGFDGEATVGLRVPIGTPISGRVFRSRKSVMLSAVSEAKRHEKDPDAPLLSGVPSLSTALCVPECVVGILNLTGRPGGRPFTPVELEYLDLICNIAASSLHDRQTHRALDEARHSIMVALAKLADDRDPDIGRHVERVTRFSHILAQQLGSVAPFRTMITEDFLNDLQRAVPIHDIGKVAVPDSILRKPGPLTAEETAVMQTHTSIGARTIRSVSERVPGVGFLALAEEIARSHHEWWNGDGYPRGLSGDAIPPAARIVAVADAYDVITTDRVYKAARSHEAAVTIINEASGAQFDPKVVEAFRRSEGEFRRLAAELADEVVADISPSQAGLPAPDTAPVGLPPT